jgi:hypothetical protein
VTLHIRIAVLKVRVFWNMAPRLPVNICPFLRAYVPQCRQSSIFAATWTLNINVASSTDMSATTCFKMDTTSSPPSASLGEMDGRVFPPLVVSAILCHGFKQTRAGIDH